MVLAECGGDSFLNILSHLNGYIFNIDIKRNNFA
jgi:hypothetical protein